MHPSIERRLVTVLAAVSAVEIVLAAVPWLVDPLPFSSVADVAPGSEAASQAIPPSETRPLGSFTAFTARPLFTASRRPPPADTVKGGPPSSAQGIGVILGRYRLTGVVVTPTVRIAFMMDLKDNESFAVSEGEKLGDWVFAEIARESITLQSNGRREVFPLRTATNTLEAKD